MPSSTTEEILEKSFENLKSDYGIFVLLSFIYYVSAIVIAAIGASLKSGISGILIIIGLLAYVSSPIVLLLLTRLRSNWNFKETIKLEKAADYLIEIKNILPTVYQRATLQKIFSTYSDNSLEMKFTPDENFDPNAPKVGINEINLSISFKTNEEDLILDITYSGSAFLGFSDSAIKIYKKAVLEFRSSLKEVIEKAKLEKEAKINFSEIVKLIDKYGIILKEIKCPKCGGKIELPKNGYVVECPYCGATVEAIDVYKVIKELMKEIQ